MSDVEFFVTPGFGEKALEMLHYSRAVRIGNRVEISGQGGWDDHVTFPEFLEAEIIRAFENVEPTLAMAGASWRDVVQVNSYHVASEPDTIGGAHNDVMVAVEIRVTAIVGD